MRSLISSVALVCNNGVWTISGYGVPLNSPVRAKFVGEWAILQRIHMTYIELYPYFFDNLLYILLQYVCIISQATSSQ